MAFSVIIIKGAGFGLEHESNAANPAVADGDVFKLIFMAA